jgi:hypothetical protein
MEGLLTPQSAAQVCPDIMASGGARTRTASAVRGRGRLRFFPLVDLNELDGGDRRDPDGLPSLGFHSTTLLWHLQRLN